MVHISLCKEHTLHIIVIMFPVSNVLLGVKHANIILYQPYSGPTLTDHIRWVRPRPLDHALLYVGLCSDLT